MTQTWHGSEYAIVHGAPCLVRFANTDGKRKDTEHLSIAGDFALAYDAGENILLKHGSAARVDAWAQKTRQLMMPLCPDICEALTVLTIPRHALTPEVLTLINRTLNTTGTVGRLIDDLQKVTNLPPAPPTIPD